MKRNGLGEDAMTNMIVAILCSFIGGIAFAKWWTFAKRRAALYPRLPKGVYECGMLVFENDKKSFEAWLNAKIVSLDHKRPIDLIKTEEGAQKVCDALMRIEYSVYS